MNMIAMGISLKSFTLVKENFIKKYQNTERILNEAKEGII